MTPEQKHVYDLKQSGLTLREIADAIGISLECTKSRWKRAKKWVDAPEGQREAIKNTGLDMDRAKAGWRVVVRDDGSRDSVYWRAEDDTQTRFVDAVADSLAEYSPLNPALFAPRVNLGSRGDKLMVLDLADVHFGKLATLSETGHEYNVDVARHRVIEGTKKLLQRADGICRILFVMGNDILHTDNGKTTTSGTPQDTDGTYFTAWRAAQYASIDAIKECTNYGEVDLIHCMSNHDWRSGWALSQLIGAEMNHHDGVRATAYNLSEKHLKFYGYGRNGMLLTHGDGAKEESLTSLFLKQGRNLVSQCDLLYAYLHHFHHKKRARRGIDVFQSEKDHTAFTQINTGATHVEGNGMQAEYIRSPSVPDGWHDRNGYVNRQAVEAFLHCPHDGQKDRLTEWF